MRLFPWIGTRRGSRILKWGWIFVAKAWKRGVFGLHAGLCVHGLKMNKLIGRTGHRLCTFSTSIREIREINYHFNIWGIREKKKKEWGSEKGGEIHPFHLPWIRAWVLVSYVIVGIHEQNILMHLITIRRSRKQLSVYKLKRGSTGRCRFNEWS